MVTECIEPGIRKYFSVLPSPCINSTPYHICVHITVLHTVEFNFPWIFCTPPDFNCTYRARKVGFHFVPRFIFSFYFTLIFCISGWFFYFWSGKVTTEIFSLHWWFMTVGRWIAPNLNHLQNLVLFATAEQWCLIIL